MFETGHFASLWQRMAPRLGLEPEFLSVPRHRPGDRRCRVVAPRRRSPT